jgi:hypothetical protein
MTAFQLWTWRAALLWVTGNLAYGLAVFAAEVALYRHARRRSR